MDPERKSSAISPQITLHAKLRMSCFLLILFVIHLIESYITFPFVDHTSSIQNVIYGLAVGVPFIIINIVFILLTRNDMISLQ